MSFSVKKILKFPQGGLDFESLNDIDIQHSNDFKLIGGISKDTHYVWQAKGPVLEVRNSKNGYKVGAWVFGGILKDSNTKIVCVEEMQRPNGRISLLVVGIECTISGGIICIFDVFSSKVIRAIQIKAKISTLHVVDPGIEDLNLPGPLRNFDGILAVGTETGDVILIDICRQICEENIHLATKKDELDPSQVVLLTSKHMPKIENYKEKSVRDGKHLGIHLNAVLDITTDHFVLKGPKGDDRVHVNKEEVLISAIYYCTQLTSILIGYNFGAFQIWDLTNLKLVYTSPVCEEHIPITNFALQEPADDPRAFCYVWVSYSNTELLQPGLPFAVMYALCYESKEYHEGYGYLYQDFHYCNIRFQIELGHFEEHRAGGTLPKGGYCLGIQPITKVSTVKESFSHPSSDTSSLCLISWTVWYSKSDTQTCSLLFDLNQWYKEQMPSFTKWKDCNNFILRVNLSDLVVFNEHQHDEHILKVVLAEKSVLQFMGVQKLEEHFYPSSYSFDLRILRESDTISVFSRGLQKALLAQIETAGPLCLLRPIDICRQAIGLGLTPLFVDVLPPTGTLSIESQREIVLNIALEQQLISWLCKCASEWANGSFSATGCSLDFLISWAFQRAIVLKSNCDKFCAPLFDYSQSRLDANTSDLLNSSTRQIGGLCVLYKHIAEKLGSFVNCLDTVKEHWTRLEMVSVYFEVLQWLVNVGLLPECHPSTYPRSDNLERISAPYPVQELTQYYNEKRAGLCLSIKDSSFESSDNLLFIDNLINRKCGGSKLQTQWQEDGGSGLYPPPSLQSLIRTYLVDGAGISNKHSLVIYLFLDLAMALDQSRYSSVVTHLIKFPAVFKVSPSVIKITQAFWQLDHGDFTTAMDQLLDPFVLGEDLQPWHHTIAMRSLLINKQPNFALMYMKIRKPPISDEKDILTAISLFIANNMLDEAFYFKKEHQNDNEEKLLIHLFRECSKNDALHRVLYKCLNNEEEKTFFKYLKSVHNPTSEDLQIFYYLLRSRFIEAFDAHSEIRRKCPDRQGLVGQSEATKTDQIVRVFKTLLPDVNKKLVEYIRKERNNLWKEVQRPTPMSVFVHNTKEQVQYKSTLIHAALAKAKHTFQNSFSEELLTEETPFIRTPTISKHFKRVTTSVITPTIIEDNNDMYENEAPSCKRMKLSPRLSSANLRSPLRTNAQQITAMPIVKRKISFQLDRSYQNHSNATSLSTPQSILKATSLVKNRTADDDIGDEDGDYQIRTDPSLQASSISLRLQPRASLSHTPKRQHVQFEEATRFSSSTLSDQSGRQLDTTSPEDLNKHKSLPSKDITTKNISSDAEESNEVFYSPDNSANNLAVVDDNERQVEILDTRNSDVIKEIKSSPPKEKVTVSVLVAEVKEPADDEPLIRSPSGRRSYKRSLRDSSPLRSSPRLSKLYSKKCEDQNTSTTESSTISDNSLINESEFSDSLSPKPKLLPKVKGRKSLSRQVLEHNTFLKRTDTIPKEKSYTKTETVTITEKSLEHLKVTRVESNLKMLETDSSKFTSFSSSVKKNQVLESSMESDTSSEDSFQFEVHNESELSESLHEYMEKIIYANKMKKEALAKQGPSKIHLSSGDAEKELSEKEPLHQKEEAIIVEEGVHLVEENLDEEMQIEKEEFQLNVEETPAAAANDEECFLVYPQEEMEVNVIVNTYEGVIRESARSSVFATLTPVQIQENNEIYEEIYDIKEISQEESFNELENNIFGLPDETKRSIVIPDDDISEMNADNAFIVDSFNDISDVKVDEVITISDEEGNSTDRNTSSDTDGSEEYHLKLNTSDDLSSDEKNSKTSDNGQENIEKFKSNEEDHKIDELVNKIEENYRDVELEDRNNDELEENDREDANEAHKNDELEEKVEEDCRDVSEEDYQNDKLEKKSREDDEEDRNNDKLKENYLEDYNNELENKFEEIRQNVEENQKFESEIVEERNNTMVVLIEESEKDVESCTTQLDPLSNIIHAEKEKLTTTTTTACKEGVQHVKIGTEIVRQDKAAIIQSKQRLPKVDSCTNTTIIADEKTDQISETHNINKLTNKIIPEKKVEAEKIQESLIENTLAREVYSSRIKQKCKTFAEDQTTSSSDTTEGETFRKEVVVTVQVHNTPNMTEKDEEIPAKITTRQTCNNEENDVKGQRSTHKKKEPVLGKRTRRIHSASDKIDCEPNESLKLIDDSNVAVKLTLRKRSASVDQIRTFSRQELKRNKSSTTAEEIKEESGGVRKALSVSQMPVISEEETTASKAKKKKSKSVVDSYATSRRLTRRQANIVKNITDVMKKDHEENKNNISLEVEDLDPINLLEKSSFEGKPDPDEKIVYEQSPSTSSTKSLLQNRRGRSRSSSVASEVSSISPSQNEPTTSKKGGGRSSRSQTKSPAATGMSTRSKKHSESSSVISEKSVPSTSKRTKNKKIDAHEVGSSARTTRSRSVSVSSDKSDSSRTIVRARRIISAKSDLPEITEEKVDDITATSKKRRTKKKM